MKDEGMEKKNKNKLEKNKKKKPTPRCNLKKKNRINSNTFFTEGEFSFYL